MKQETKQNIKDWANLRLISLVVIAMVNNLKGRISPNSDKQQSPNGIQVPDSANIVKNDTVAADTVAKYAFNTARQLKR